MEQSGTHNAGRIIRRMDNILQSEFVQVERATSHLWISAVKTVAASHKLKRAISSVTAREAVTCVFGSRVWIHKLNRVHSSYTG